MTNEAYDSSIHHVTKEPVKPTLFKLYGKVNRGGQFEVRFLGDTFITREVWLREGEETPRLSFKVERGNPPDQVAAVDWLAEQVARDKDRYGIAQSGAQVFPNHVVFSSGTLLEELTAGGGE